jgi:hypothetical protein
MDKKMVKLFIVFVFIGTTLFAQEDTTITATFHFKRNADKHNGIAFSYGCSGKHKDVFIDKDGNADFYWGADNNPTSASFTNDTALVTTFQTIITSSFIDTLNQLYNTDHRCGYFVRILENGRTINGAIIDEGLVNESMPVPNKLRMLIKLLDELNDRFAFPK